MTGNSNAASGGGKDVVFGKLDSSDIIFENGDYVVTLPENIDTLYALTAFSVNDSGYGLWYPGSITSNLDLDEAVYRITNRNMTETWAGELTIDGNKVHVHTNWGNVTLSASMMGAYAYIPK